jgi:hypothetical protein
VRGEQVSTGELGKRKRLKRIIWLTVGIILVLQLYFVRELLAAELIFGIAFSILFSIVLIIYAIGRMGERGFSWAESRARVLAAPTRKWMTVLEEISRKPFRHPRSESAR